MSIFSLFSALFTSLLPEMPEMNTLMTMIIAFILLWIHEEYGEYLMHSVDGEEDGG